MLKMKNILYAFFIIFGIVIPKNLILHDFDSPSASHILDVTITDDLLIVSGMLGGIEFYDISNPEVLNHLDNLQLSGGGGGGGGGGGSKPNCIVTSGNYAYVTTNQGLGVINISNPSNPQYLGIVSGTNGYILENLDVYEDILAVAAHEDGVLFFDISNPTNPEHFLTYETSNAWAVKLEPTELFGYEFIIYTANSGYVDISGYWVSENNSEGVSEIGELEVGSAVKDIVLGNDLLYFALGTDGVNVYLTAGTDPTFPDGMQMECYMHAPCYLGTYETSVLANRVELLENKVAVSVTH